MAATDWKKLSDTRGGQINHLRRGGVAVSRHVCRSKIILRIVIFIITIMHVWYLGTDWP
jgi:hypothetical protein